MSAAELPDYRPLLSLVELTLRCNLRCVHCGSTSGRPRREEMSEDELEQVVRDLAELGAQELVLLGGEPLLHPGWDRLCTLAADVGLAPLLITNGMLVDAAAARRCVQSGVVRVGVSVDGPTAEVHDRIRGVQGSHARAVEAVRRLLDHGVTCTVITCVSRLNLRSLPHMRDQLAGAGVGWQIQVAAPNGARFDPETMISRSEFYAVARFIARCRSTYSLEDLPVAGAHDIGYHSCSLRNYGYRPSWTGCQGGLSTVGIQSDGVIKPCLALAERFAEGSIRDPGLRSVWQSPDRFVRNRRFRCAWLVGGCRACEHGASCRAGCPDMAFNATGSPFDNPYCLRRIEQDGVDDDQELWDTAGSTSGGPE